MYVILFRTISTMGTKWCNICYKIVCSQKTSNSDEKKHLAENHAVKSLIPGLSTSSEEKSPTDSNLSPFQICNSKSIQYGDTSILSTSTENPEWSPGECLNIFKYEGRFIKKQCNVTNQVIS